MNALMMPEKTMSSREIAELTGKEHRNVMRDIRAMLVELHSEDRVLSFEQTVNRPNPSGGAPIKSTVYALPKRETLILVSGYNLTMRAKIIDRWQELEAQQPAFDPMKALADPVTMRGLLLTYSEKVIALEAENESMKDDVKALDRIAKAENSLCLTDAAKALGKPRDKLIKWLSAHDWIYKRHGGGTWLGYSDKEKQGLVEHKLSDYESKDGSIKVSEQVRITPKGMVKLAKMLAKGDVA